MSDMFWKMTMYWNYSAIHLTNIQQVKLSVIQLNRRNQWRAFLPATAVNLFSVMILKYR